MIKQHDIEKNSAMQHTTGVYGDYYSLLPSGCTSNGGTIQKDKMYHCLACYKIWSNTSVLKKIKEVVKYRGGNLRVPSDNMSRIELATINSSLLNSFVAIEEKWLSSLGKELKRRVWSQMDYSKHVESSSLRTKKYMLVDGKVPCRDKFLFLVSQ